MGDKAGRDIALEQIHAIARNLEQKVKREYAARPKEDKKKNLILSVRGAKPRATIYALFRAVLAKVLTSNPKALMASDKQCRVKLLCIIGWILNISATGI